MTWRQEAAAIIHEATKRLPENATLADRKRAVDGARPKGWMYISWPKKAWQAARRDYLCRYGYVSRRTKPTETDLAAGCNLPLFRRADREGGA